MNRTTKWCHAQQRAWERYNLVLSGADLVALEARLARQGAGQRRFNTSSDDLNIVRLVASVKGKRVRLVYDTANMEIITFLPRKKNDRTTWRQRGLAFLQVKSQLKDWARGGTTQ